MLGSQSVGAPLSAPGAPESRARSPERVGPVQSVTLEQSGGPARGVVMRPRMGRPHPGQPRRAVHRPHRQPRAGPTGPGKRRRRARG